MRLWTLHPRYLDARGLVALWREGLLAQAVLRHRTSGYVHHPQLQRFRSRPSPLGAIAQYLRAVHMEAARRGYAFAVSKVGRSRDAGRMRVTRGQLLYEREHLLEKLARRDATRAARLRRVIRPAAHPSFRVVSGGVEVWEKVVHRR